MYVVIFFLLELCDNEQHTIRDEILIVYYCLFYLPFEVEMVYIYYFSYSLKLNKYLVKISHNMQNPIKKEIGCIGLVSFFILDDSEYANIE